MAVYVDSPESGSMFENILETNTNIYAVSSSSSTQDAYASYCAPKHNIVVSNNIYTDMKTCLGDLFSTNWIEDAESSNMATKTLYDNFIIDQ